MESFYEAAEYYFRTAPWSRVPGEVPIEIRCSDPPMGTRFAIVLGRTGVQLGLCIYDDWETARAVIAGYAAADDSRALVVCYDEAQIMSAVDLQLIERLGWPIATPEAWPAVMRLEPHRLPRSASARKNWSFWTPACAPSPISSRRKQPRTPGEWKPARARLNCTWRAIFA